MPPSRLVTRIMELAMVVPAEWNREIVADFAAHRTRLSEPHMMSIGWCGTAEQTWLRSDISEMLFIADPVRLIQGKGALVNTSHLRPGIHFPQIGLACGTYQDEAGVGFTY